MEQRTRISSATLERIRIRTGIRADATEESSSEDVLLPPIIRSHWATASKRALDLSASALLLTFSLPLILLAAIAVMLESLFRRSWANPFFGQSRIGINGQTFTLWKIRSMIPNAESLLPALSALNVRADGPLFKALRDPRVLWVGKILRSTSMDELPQLWNVLRGDMSLVGPRPHKEDEVAQYTPSQRFVLTVLPGITGMAQTHGRDQNTFKREIHLDRLYIKKWSLAVDIRIILLTPLVLLERPLQDLLAAFRPVLKDAQDIPRPSAPPKNDHRLN